jgi:hypothetical protein
LTLVKTWPGEFGFDRFLREFSDGKRVFSQEDFPENAASLNTLGVGQISVSFGIGRGNLVTTAVRKLESDSIARVKLLAEKQQIQRSQSDLEASEINSKIARLVSKTSQEALLPARATECVF